MKGFYVVKENGVEVGRCDNLLTTSGKKIQAAYLAGLAPRWAGAICVGSIATAASASDSRLGFEWARAPISATAVNYGAGTSGTHRLVFKATLDQSYSGQIYELGVYPNVFNLAAGAGQSNVLSYADSTETWQEYVTGTGWTTITTSPSTGARAGVDMPLLQSVTGAFKRYRLAGVTLDLSSYSDLDLVNLAFLNNNNNPTTLNLRFNTDDNNYYQYSTIPSTFLGTVGQYKNSTAARSSFIATGTPDWTNITSFEVQLYHASAICNLYLDGIRIEDNDTYSPDYALVSHAIPASPISKTAGTVMDIEYYVDVSS